MSTLKVLLHAPTPDALTRARSNAKNLLAARPDAVIEIIVNAQGAKAAVQAPDEASTSITRVCANSLAKQGLEPPAAMQVIEAAVVYLAERQAEGWAYIRC
ncbi:MAG: hypothetical protein AAF590_02310 [Pseudomonadota bacterium]